MRFDLPPIPDRIDPDLRKALTRIREELQALMGTRGSDPAVRLTQITGGPGGSGALVLLPGTGPGGGVEAPDLTPPPTPTFGTGDVVAGISQVIVSWAGINYTQGHGNKQTIVYAVKKDPSDPTMPTFPGDAGIVAIAPHALTLIAIPSEPNTRWHVWLKFETNDGVQSTSPAGGTNGVQATTGQDVAHLLTVLTGKITQSQLFSTLSSRIDLIDGASGLAGSVNARIAVEAGNRAAALAALSAVKSRTFYSATEPVSDGSYTLQVNDTWIETDNSNKRYRYSGSAWVAADDTRIGQTVTDLSNEITNRTNGDNAEIAVRESLYAGLGAAIGTDYKVFNQASTPTGTTIGDVWTWKAGGTETFQRWNGSGWVDSLGNKRAAVYLGEYANAGALPGSAVIGDLARQGDTNAVVVWNGSAWVAKTSMPAPVYAFVESEKASRIAGDSAEASARDTLAVQLRGTYTGTDIDSVTTGLIHSERQARATAIGVQASRVDTLEAKVDSPSATPGSNYNPTYAALQTTASTLASLDGRASATYAVRAQISSGGRTLVGGFGLMGNSSAGPGAEFDFGVLTNRFYVGAPAGSGLDDRLPFIIQANDTTINGVFVPAGVYMDTAFIRDGTITNAKIGNAAIDDAKVANLSAAKLTVGDGTVGGNLKSTSYTGGSGSTPGTGWLLTPGGNVFLNNAIVYGTVYATNGVFSGSLSGASITGATGNFTGTLNGANITGATGTFSGSLNVSSGGSSRVEITTSRIKVFNGGVERVRIGDLS